MTPPASTETMYLISESELKTLTHYNWMEYWDRIRARGPVVAQQVPTSFNIDAFEEKLCEYLGVNFPDWNMAKHERHCEDIGSLAEDCLISLAEHDAALIAQEREKWERERKQKNPKGSPDGWCMPQCDFFGDCDAADVRSCKRDAKKHAHDTVIAAQAREDVLKKVDNALAESYDKSDLYDCGYRGGLSQVREWLK